MFFSSLLTLLEWNGMNVVQIIVECSIFGAAQKQRLNNKFTTSICSTSQSNDKTS